MARSTDTIGGDGRRRYKWLIEYDTQRVQCFACIAQRPTVVPKTEQRSQFGCVCCRRRRLRLLVHNRALCVLCCP